MIAADDAGALVDEATRAIRGPDGEPQFFADPAMDRFVAVLLNMASELWVQEERLRTLEGKAGDDAAAREAAAKGFIDRVFAPLREPGATSPRQ